MYEADVPSEQQGAKLIEIAERLRRFSRSRSPRPGDTPKIEGLKNDVQAVIEAGDLASADELLAQIEAEQRSPCNAKLRLMRRPWLGEARLRLRGYGIAKQLGISPMRRQFFRKLTSIWMLGSIT